MKYLVRCTLYVEVEWPYDASKPHASAEFALEENSCPGTHAVGAAISRAIERGGSESVCWACNLHGSNKIVAVDGVPLGISCNCCGQAHVDAQAEELTRP